MHITILEQDKWRNMSVMANGWGSRDKARVALRRIQHVPKQDENTFGNGAVQSDEESAELMPPTVSSDTQQMQLSYGPKRTIVRLDTFIEFGIFPFLSHWGTVIFLLYGMLS